MGIPFTTGVGFLLTVTIGFLFTITLGIQLTVSTSHPGVEIGRAVARGFGPGEGSAPIQAFARTAATHAAHSFARTQTKIEAERVGRNMVKGRKLHYITSKVKR
jgi:hypothetical protein